MSGKFALIIGNTEYTDLAILSSGGICDPADLCQYFSHIINQNNTRLPIKIISCR